MKRLTNTAWIAFLVMLLCGCQKQSYQVQLHQPEDEITHIVIIDNTGLNKGIEPIEILVIEEDDEIADFLFSLRQLKCYKFYNDPATSYGYLYIQIIYENGAADIIGTDMLAYRSANGTNVDVYDGWYYADMESMLELCKQYELVPTLPY